MTDIKKEIERIVDKYVLGDPKELLTIELNLLVELAEKEQIIKDYDDIIKLIKGNK